MARRNLKSVYMYIVELLAIVTLTTIIIIIIIGHVVVHHRFDE